MADELAAQPDFPTISVIATVGARPNPHSEMDALLLGRTKVSTN